MKIENPHYEALLTRASIIESIIIDMKKIGHDFLSANRCNVSFLELDVALSDFQRELEESDTKENYTSGMFRGEDNEETVSI